MLEVPDPYIMLYIKIDCYKDEIVAVLLQEDVL